MVGQNALKQALLNFDGKNLSVLGEAETKYSGVEDYLDQLIAFCSDGEGCISSGASWLIKFHVENETPLSDERTRNLLSQLDLVIDWQTQLHICQVIRYLNTTPKDAQKVQSWLAVLLNHQRPFLRAWSLDALWHLSLTHNQFRNDALVARARGLQDSAASVRARARNLKE